MNKYKICVYAICKNEEKFVNRWCDSMSEADDIYVLDTGSSDKTVKLLKERKVKVFEKKIDPWRFDVARNLSLNLIKKDYDIYVCTDLDEVFEKNWRKKIEESWKENTTRLRYTYNWSLDKNNKPIISFLLDNIHNKNYIWENPVHEVLVPKDREIYETNESIVLNHYPDHNKSRSSYLPLLELAIKENPFNDRNMHYLGREYMYYKRYNDAIDTLIKHLSLKTATWSDERCASMRFIARCYSALKRYDEAYLWADKAIKEAPYLREAFMEKALISYSLDNYKDTKKNALKALKLDKERKTYINEYFSSDKYIYDILSICYFNEKKYKLSLRYCKKALKEDLDNERLKQNIKIIKEQIKNSFIDH